MGLPQITFIVLLAIDLGIAMAKHGQPRKGQHNFIASLVASAILLFLVWRGGFFG